MLNCKLVGAVISGYTVDNHFSAHAIEYIRIPAFDPDDGIHGRLAVLSRDAHHAAAKDDQPRLRTAEREIDRVVVKIWEN